MPIIVDNYYPGQFISPLLSFRVGHFVDELSFAFPSLLPDATMEYYPVASDGLISALSGIVPHGKMKKQANKTRQKISNSISNLNVKGECKDLIKYKDLCNATTL